MNILFVHQNFPGQYLHLARHLMATGEHTIKCISQREQAPLPEIENLLYRPTRKSSRYVHHYLRDTESHLLNAQQVARAAMQLKKSGFVPDVMLGHNGWGEIWYLKDVFPQTPLIGYFEFFYRRFGADIGFDPADKPIFDTGPRIRTKNLGNLLALDTVDLGQCPTRWQYSLYPRRYRPLLRVVHEGIDTSVVHPDSAARLALPNGTVLQAGDEVVTYVARNLEPYRGFPSFMRSLPAILVARPQAQVIVVGGDDASYGPPPANGQTFRQQLLEELGDDIDLNRVHFLGKVPYTTFLQVLQVSAAHIYLTYPFVLSWSMLEAMAAGALVIGSRTAPVQEVIAHGKNGLLVDFFAPDEIANAAIAVLTHPKPYQALRHAARQTIVERYDLHRICLPAQLRLLEEATGRPIASSA